jgi:hypothetical protein
MLRNSEEKLSMSRAEHAHLRGEVVVGDDRGNRGGEADRRGDQRLGDARRDRLDARRLRRREPRNAFMMPQTVPKRPMNGAARPWWRGR